MDFLFVTTEELSALMGLPHLQRLAYLMAIRPYMDRRTLMVGVKRRISYQSLAEILYVEPHPGIQSGSPSKQQLRRVINGLEQAGLIQILSTDKNLILKCLLADTAISVPNKADTIPTRYPDTNPVAKNPALATVSRARSQNPDISNTAQADIPHNSENNYVCVYSQFEKFWEMYPKKNAKQKAFEEFKALQPTEELVSEILNALQQQIDVNQALKTQGQWIPKWKFPANWLAQHCWKDEITPTTLEEKNHATNQGSCAKNQSIDLFWEACKSGAKPSTGNGVITGKPKL